MVKKIVGLAGAGAILFSLVVPALAVVNKNDALVDTWTDTRSNTGRNIQSNMAKKKSRARNSIVTGAASSMTDALMMVNENEIVVKAKWKPNTKVGNSNYAFVTTSIFTGSNTGANIQSNAAQGKSVVGADGANSIDTGDADSSTSATSMINSNYIKIRGWGTWKFK